MSKSENKDASAEQQVRHAEYIRHAIEQVKDLGGTQDENLGTALGPSDPKQVGPYQILSILGKGGMGKVYLAQQPPPLRRRVALKVIKPGMDTEQVLARFEAERQALALLDHSNIAKVFDAATTEEGRPYFAMEYIEGERITEYCDRHQLDTTARLRLFMQVCEGVQHAHQKAIIHRDIKPSNILVTEQDGKPVPKIIDFGVAKATEQNLTERSLQTEIGQLIGTLGYMSREQLRTPHDVDTRTDVYSLGVVLYELLVGEPPFDLTTLGRAAIMEAARLVAEKDPLRPSTKLTSLGEDSWTTVVRNRQTNFQTLRKALTTDLDWIAMKAIEKDRTRRYATATALAEDVLRHLHQKPVVASPPSNAYVLTKFLQRNKSSVAAITAIILALSAGLSAAAVMYARAERSRAEAATQRDQALQARAESEAVTAFLTDMFASIRPERARGREIPAREIVDQASEKLAKGFTGPPLVEAALRAVLGRTYFGLGLYDAADPHLDRALSLRRQYLPPEHLDLAVSIYNLGTLRMTKGDFAAAESLYREALAMRRRLLGDQHALVAEALQGLGWTLSQKGDDAGPERLLREALAIRRKVQNADHPDVAWNLHDLAEVLWRKGDWDGAEPLYREALEIRRKNFGRMDLGVAQSATGLAWVLLHKEDYDGAEPLYREGLEIMRHVLGNEHANVTFPLNGLAQVLLAKGDLDGAEPLMREALEIRRKTLGSDHPRVAGSLVNVGKLLQEKGELDESESLMREALAIYRKAFPSGHQETILALANLANVLAAKGNQAEAEQMLREALDIGRRVLSKVHPYVLSATYSLGSVLVDKGDCESAEKLLRETVEDVKGDSGEHAPKTLQTMNELAMLLWKCGKFTEGEPIARAAVVGYRTLEERPLTDLLSSLDTLAVILRDLNRLDEAEVVFKEIFAVDPTKVQAPPAYFAELRLNYGKLLIKAKRFEEAEATLNACHDTFTSPPARSKDLARQAIESLIGLYDSWDAAEPGKGYAEKAAEWRARLDETSKEQGTESSNERNVGTPNSGNAEGSKNDDREAPK